MHFSKKSGRLLSVGSEILAFGSHSSAKFEPILDFFMPNFKLKYEDSENMKTDRVNTVVFNLPQIKQRNVLDTRYNGQSRMEQNRCNSLTYCIVEETVSHSWTRSVMQDL